ncbi:hypothetical protein [Bacillus thuringiensis]|uniref:hypothetical protein n=1 Tax=Bacillus thuringiensis TaxID=1428 RepID=UPI000BFD027D|nr:hypothetical protein [Bacillus thuringiensis]PGP53335.1 hypothetical protein COA06_01060 [Bacillus thuringiensis]
MAKYYGYCYDSNGKFTEIIPLEEKPVYEKQTQYRWESKEVVTEEKLCEVHQENKDGKHDCPNCVMRKVEHEDVQVPYEEDVIVGYEPDIPVNCTLEVCPGLIFEPVFREGKWVKTAEPKPEEPKPEEPKPQEPSELEKLKKEMKLMQKAIDELIVASIQ